MFERKINLFEKIILVTGMLVVTFGFYLLIQADIISKDVIWLRLIALFNWLILIIIMIVAATNVDMKEELSLISKEHVAEIRLLKEIVNDQLDEMKMLRHELSKKKK
ncbi:hypothetical protein JXB41_01130 [Candidatus Woesearchaeota archaeon]|nr:hypothetical protein [Candidatus Woesearchaeota archaeon]